MKLNPEDLDYIPGDLCPSLWHDYVMPHLMERNKVLWTGFAKPKGVDTDGIGVVVTKCSRLHFFLEGPFSKVKVLWAFPNFPVTSILYDKSLIEKRKQILRCSSRTRIIFEHNNGVRSNGEAYLDKEGKPFFVPHDPIGQWMSHGSLGLGFICSHVALPLGEDVNWCTMEVRRELDRFSSHRGHYYWPPPQGRTDPDEAVRWLLSDYRTPIVERLEKLGIHFSLDAGPEGSTQTDLAPGFMNLELD